MNTEKDNVNVGNGFKPFRMFQFNANIISMSMLGTVSNRSLQLFNISFVAFERGH